LTYEWKDGLKNNRKGRLICIKMAPKQANAMELGCMAMAQGRN
jgi:hypothetical protein